MIHNPILKGFCPDPSIIRVGEDYFIATSTFEWWPGVRLWHSTDLQNWTQIPSPLQRESQLNLQGDPCSGGVWAPCLTYDGERFFLVYTDVKTKKGRFYNTHNYVVWSDDIYGPWSEPVYLNSIGFDPSLFHDSDGRKYLVNMINGFKGILVQELEPETMKLIGERKMVYEGSGLGCLEGPHIYHIGEWYYLVAAEGGTGYDHGVTMARAKSVWGPFETAPNNPIITSDKEDPCALQKCGHGDLIDTPEGEWYMVHLCSRPVPETKWCTLGRETAIQKLRLKEDGWFEMYDGGNFGKWTTPGLGEETGEAQAKTALQGAATVKDASRKQEKGVEISTTVQENLSFYDDFADTSLDLRYSAPRLDYHYFVDLKSRPGYLRMKGMESMNSLHKVSHLAVRQQAYECEVETSMEFVPKYEEQMAGLSYAYDARCFYLLAKTVNAQGKTVLCMLKSNTEVITDECQPVEVSKDGKLRLKVKIFDGGRSGQFYYCVSESAGVEESVGKANGKETGINSDAQPSPDAENNSWTAIGPVFTTELCSDEYARGFCGAHFGMYVHDMTGLGLHADFDYFKMNVTCS
ncbi:MAG: family 43 glycosylhydrolase [Lachnospiraceae bacterium]|nr:family 43 glycosylhydrolase [Lachnospiraceae bacterium]